MNVAKRAKRSETRERSEAKLRSPGAATVRIVFAMVCANAATQFAIQAWMSFRFARDVWAIPRPLCAAVILALDLFAVSFMVFTYLLRTAGWLSRAYVWVIFAVGVGAQLFAAELYGAHEHWTTPVRVFAGLPALFLAASLHGLIVWRNHASRTPARPPIEAPAPPPATAVTAPTERPAPRPARQPKAARPTGKAPTDRKTEYGRLVIEEGQRPAELALDAGVSKRTIEIWARQYRERYGLQLAGAEPPEVSDQRINGAEPAIEVPHGA